uniref:Dynein heavy chain tail domain-containing protein n=1 Tax=Mola mola TaxID=94237 RepID=A0A3Q3XF65_MOLML
TTTIGKYAKLNSIIHSLGSAAIEWSHLSGAVLKKEYSETLPEDRNPTSHAELLFWKNGSAYADLECIHSQLKSSKMVLLEAVESSYSPALTNMQRDVLAALEEARDICTYLRPLQHLFEEMENMEFPDVRGQIGLLMHMVCLVWVSSQYYSTPAHLIVLQRETCNLLIQQAQVYLVPEELLKGEVSENLLKVQTTLEILQFFRSTYEQRRANLSQYKRNGNMVRPWDFSPMLVFSGLDHFINRINMIKDILLTAIGGAQARTAFGVFDCHPAGLSAPQDYEEHVTKFKLKVDDTDRRLGAIFCQAFEGAAGLEHAFKVLDMFSSLLERPSVALDKELDSCKLLYDKCIQATEQLGLAPVNKNMPAVAGGLRWAQELQQRIQGPFLKIRHLPYQCQESPEGTRVLQKYEEMMQLLDRCVWILS